MGEDWGDVSGSPDKAVFMEGAVSLDAAERTYRNAQNQSELWAASGC